MDESPPTAEVVALRRRVERERKARAEAERLLERRSRELFESNAELERRLAQIEAQDAMLRVLTAPIIRVWERVLLVPLSGRIDAETTALLTSTLLEAAAGRDAAWVIFDASGVIDLGRSALERMRKIVDALRLLGVAVVITGIRPAIAGVIAAAGVQVPATIRRDLADGLRFCIERTTGAPR
ncbi:MAG: STAS domain-containing protein [Nannocystaceae bacterium]